MDAHGDGRSSRSPGVGDGRSVDSIASGSSGGSSSSSSGGHAGCPHLITDELHQLPNLVLDPADKSAQPPKLKDVLHRYATGVRWGKKLRSGHFRPEDDDEDDGNGHRSHLDIDDKAALKRRKLLPYPSCVECGLMLHRPFICLTCASTACFYQPQGTAATQGLLDAPSTSSQGASKERIEQECHIATHLESKNHPLAFDVHRGTLYCRLCDDIVHDSRFEKAFDLEINMAANTHRLQGKRAKHLAVVADSPVESHSEAAPNSLVLPRGFRNLGMTCFMNVILQSFLHNPLLRNYFLADRHNTKLCASRENCLACEMDKLFSEFYNSANSLNGDLGTSTPVPSQLTNGASRSETPAPGSTAPSGSNTPGSSLSTQAPTAYGPTTFLFTIWLTRESAELSQAGQHDAHELFISTLNGLHASLMAPSRMTGPNHRSPQRQGSGRGSISLASGAGYQHGGGSTLSRPRARNKRLPTFPAEDRASLPRRWRQLEEIPQNGVYPIDAKKAAAVGEKRKRANGSAGMDDNDAEDDGDEDDDDDEAEDEEYFFNPAFASSTYDLTTNGAGSPIKAHPPLTPGLSGLNANACPCVVHRTFAGTIQSDVTCLQCNCTTSTRDPMLDLSLDLRSTKTSAAAGGKNGKLGSGMKKKGAAGALGLAGPNGKKKWNKKAEAMGDGAGGGGASGSGEGANGAHGIVGLKDDEQHLLTCLERYCSPEALGPQQYTCAQCGSQNGATKQLSLYRLPPVLCIQLKRFEHEVKNGATAGPVKIDVRVRFSFSLDVRDFVTPSVRAQGHGIQEDPEAYVYDLFTVIVHEGMMNTGHYTNFSRRKDGWYRFNDDKITPASASEVLSARAYQLCYIRRQLYNVRPDTVHLA